MELRVPYRLQTGFEARYGLVVTEHADGLVRAEVPMRDELLQPAGIVHGGVYASVAESLASIGTTRQLADDGRAASGSANLTSFLRPITEGTIHARARAIHRGRTTWVWEIEITDDAGRTCVVSRVTVAVRDAPVTRTDAPSAS